MSCTFEVGRNTSLVAVLNTGSGGCDESAAARMTDIFTSVGMPRAEVVSVPPARVEDALSQAILRAQVLVVLGGDGTIRAAAVHCARADRLLLPLPGGTMNMLPRALFGARAWPEALTETLAAPCIHEISGGRVGRDLFFCVAVLGAPSLWADAREALRRADLIEATKRAVAAIRRSSREPLEYRLGDRVCGKAEAVAAICPLVSRAMAADEPAFEAAAIEPLAAAGMFRLAFHALFDDWRNDPAIVLARVRHVEVKGRGRVPVILDGERVRLGRAVRLEFVPTAFRALAPASPS